MFGGLLKAFIRQRDPMPFAEGQEGQLQLSRLGQLFTAGWRDRLLLAGCCFNQTVGNAANGGGAPALVTGGGAGTTIDSDQPELILGVDLGYYLIPLRAVGSAQVDLDADAETGEIVLFADLTQAPPTTATATAGVPVNLLDGGPAFPGRCFHTVTADLTDPVASMLLDYQCVREAEISAVSHVTVRLNMDYQPLTPPIIAGPCSLVACWGGTAAVPAMFSLDFAVIPKSWVE